MGFSVDSLCQTDRFRIVLGIYIFHILLLRHNEGFYPQGPKQGHFFPPTITKLAKGFCPQDKFGGFSPEGFPSEGFPRLFYNTALMGCWGIVFTHGVWMTLL